MRSRRLGRTQTRVSTDSSPPLLSQDAARLWTCVCGMLPNEAKTRGNAAQEPFVRKFSHCRRQIPDLRVQGLVYRPLVWTADGRLHPAITRTLQYAVGIAACRNGQRMSAKSLQHRWKHEIQTALRRRGAMTRGVLSNLSVRAEPHDLPTLWNWHFRKPIFSGQINSSGTVARLWYGDRIIARFQQISSPRTRRAAPEMDGPPRVTSSLWSLM